MRLKRKLDKMIKNYTPHAVNVHVDGQLVFSRTSDGVARCAIVTVDDGNIDGIPVVKTTFGQVEGLPEQEEGVFIVVSRIVFDAAKDRSDLLVPGTAIRDEKGAVIGCNGFSR